MPFTFASSLLYTNSGGTLTPASSQIIVEDDYTITETGGSVPDTFEDQESHDITGPGIGTVTGVWHGTHTDANGVEFQVFEIIGTSFWMMGTGLDRSHFTTGATPPLPNTATANYPQSVTVVSLDDSNMAHCFARNTGIATPSGDVAIQDLAIGDTVLTADGDCVDIIWIGRQALPFAQFMAKTVEPVRLSAGALGNGLPRRDLVVSADHGIVIDGMVINASALVNGTTIRFIAKQDMAPDFTYFHIETADHNVILAEGAPTETYVDVPNREKFDNYDEYLAMFGTERRVDEMPAPRISSQRLLPAGIKARLKIKEAATLDA